MVNENISSRTRGKGMKYKEWLESKTGTTKIPSDMWEEIYRKYKDDGDVKE